MSEPTLRELEGAGIVPREFPNKESVASALGRLTGGAGTRIALGLPMYGHTSVAWVSWFCQWLPAQLARGTFNALLIRADAYLMHARNEILADARDAGCTHLFFLDQDVTVGDDAIERLLVASVEERAPVIGAAYYHRERPHPPVAGFFRDSPPFWESIEPRPSYRRKVVDLIGLGATLLDLVALERLDTPAPFDLNAPGGEDINFARRCERAGITIVVDFTIPTTHVGTSEIDGRSAQLWRDEPESQRSYGGHENH